MTAVPGITVTESVTITDFAALGRTIADADCEQQSQFLLGMEEGFDAFPCSMQMQAIKDEVQRFSVHDRRRLAAFVSKLNDYLGSIW